MAKSPFNSRPHTEVDGLPGEHHHAGDSFNSRPHTEVDPLPSPKKQSRRPFNSRPHTEVDGGTMSEIDKRIAFQFTTSHGGRRSMRVWMRAWKTFNSRPHTEVDLETAIQNELRNNLSIHDLTRRSTQYLPECIPSYTFQFTTSHGGRPPCIRR